MQISFVMLLFSDQISGRGKSFQGGKLPQGAPPSPPPCGRKPVQSYQSQIITQSGQLENKIRSGVLQSHIKMLQECKRHRTQPLTMLRFCPSCLKFLQEHVCRTLHWSTPVQTLLSNYVESYFRNALLSFSTNKRCILQQQRVDRSGDRLCGSTCS